MLKTDRHKPQTPGPVMKTDTTNLGHQDKCWRLTDTSLRHHDKCWRQTQALDTKTKHMCTHTHTHTHTHYSPCRSPACGSWPSDCPSGPSRTAGRTQCPPATSAARPWPPGTTAAVPSPEPPAASPDAPLDTAGVCYWSCTVPLTQQVYVTGYIVPLTQQVYVTGYIQSPWHSKCVLLVTYSTLDTASVCHWLCTVPLTQQVYVVNVAWSWREKRCWQSISANSMINTRTATSPCYLPYVLCIIKLLLTEQKLILLYFGVVILCFSADHVNQYPFNANIASSDQIIQYVFNESK